MNIEVYQHTEIVKFNQKEMVCPIIAGEPFVIVKSIIDGIGLNYDTAMANLKSNEKLKRYLAEWHVISEKYNDITCRSLGLNYGYIYTALPVRKVAAWLYTIQTAKVKEPAKSLLLKFQEKCDDVLFQHFFGRRELEQTYFEEKKGLLMQKRALDSKIKSLRNFLYNMPASKELSQTENELKQVKTRLQRLEQKQFGVVYSLFEVEQQKEISQTTQEK